jgi:hypothetical protein
MKNFILTIFWLSWVSFCSLLGAFSRLVPGKAKELEFELTESVCEHLYNKGILNQAEFDFEMKQAKAHDSYTMFGYWILVAPIIPILRKSNTINTSCTYFTKMWLKDAQGGTDRAGRMLENSKRVGIFAAKIINFIEKFPSVLRYSPMIALVSLIGINALVESPNYIIDIVVALYGITFMEVIAKEMTVKIVHTKLEVYATSLLLLVTYFVLAGKSMSLDYVETIKLGVTFGFIQGSLGFVIGHEIGHKKGLVNKILSKTLFTLSGYPQFWEVHNKKHHKYIGTSNDYSTAKKGQGILNYLYNQGKLYIKMLSTTNVVALVATFVFLKDAALFVATTMVTSWTLLELINFIQHYGLSRRGTKLDEHSSWDTDNDFSNAFLFNLGKHGHHHYRGANWHSDLEFISDNKIEEGYFIQTFIAAVGE